MNKYQLAVKAIIRSLQQRKGIGDMLDSIDPEIMEEIKEELETILQEELP